MYKSTPIKDTIDITVKKLKCNIENEVYINQ